MTALISDKIAPTIDTERSFLDLKPFQCFDDFSTSDKTYFLPASRPDSLKHRDDFSETENSTL